MKVFYSWQSDLSSKTNRSFIRNALKAAIKKVAAELELEDAERPELDEATTGTAGMVDISASILEKIAACAVYVADITPVVDTPNGKHIPNPNVMYELGWASHAPGHQLCIAVMNTHGNPGPVCLPFDLRNRRVLTYKLAPNATLHERSAASEALTRALADALNTNLQKAKAIRAIATPIKGYAEAFDDPSIWDGENKTITIGDVYHTGQPTTLEIDPGTRSYIRVIPSSYSDRVPEGFAVEEFRRFLTPPVYESSAGDHGPCEQGYCACWFPSQSTQAASSVGVYFDTTGETWTLDTTPLWRRNDEVFWNPPRMARNWRNVITNSMKLLGELGADDKRLVVVGAVNLRNTKFHLNTYSQAIGLKDSIRHQEERADWNDETILDFVLAAYNKSQRAFGMRSIDRGELLKVIR